MYDTVFTHRIDVRNIGFVYSTLECIINNRLFFTLHTIKNNRIWLLFVDKIEEGVSEAFNAIISTPLILIPALFL